MMINLQVGDTKHHLSTCWTAYLRGGSHVQISDNMFCGTIISMLADNIIDVYMWLRTIIDVGSTRGQVGGLILMLVKS